MDSFSFSALLLIITLSLIYAYQRLYSQREHFDDQTNVPHPQPAPLSWNFQSPKSNIKNFNERTTINQGLNEVQGYSSNLIGLNQPTALWIYPYTYLNRRFDHILLSLTNKIEKDHNNNRQLDSVDNNEWTQDYPYTITTWDLLPEIARLVIIDIIAEINRRFNTDPPIVGYKKDIVQFYWIDHYQLIIKVTVYKRYTASDILYPLRELDPGINDDLKDNFERDMIIYIDNLRDGNLLDRRYHLKYLRFPSIVYDKTNPMDDIPYAGNVDHYGYLAESKDPNYHLYTVTEARDVYLSEVDRIADAARYKCFFPMQSFQRVDDRTSCELAGGVWDKQCTTDSDCPYFQANKNYPNFFGKCNTDTGFCQFPLGVEPLTYRKPKNPKDAFCYNCADGMLGKGTIGRCCDEQKDKHRYSNLASPDYAFLGDKDRRFFYRDYLDSYDINWSRYI